MVPLVFGALLAFLVSVLVTRLARTLAVRFDHVDRPDERKRHARAVPRVGGVGIAAGVFAGLAAATALGGGAAEAAPLLVGAAAIVLLGVWDDLLGLGFKRRFVVQTVVAYGMVLAGWHVDVSNLPLLGALSPFDQSTLAVPITMLWVVGLINAVNLIDGLDGLVGGVATVAFGALALASPGDPLLLAICAVGIAATLGFLVYNVHPASIFMGDTGSTLIGFLLAMAGLRAATGAPTLGLLAVPVVILGLPILDTVTTTARRLAHGTSPFLPDADHLHHRVLERSHGRVRRAVTAIWGAAAVFGGLGVALSRADGSDLVQGACMLAAVAFSYLVVRRLRYVRLRVLWRKAQRRWNHRRRDLALRPAAAVAGPPARPASIAGDGYSGRVPHLETHLETETESAR